MWFYLSDNYRGFENSLTWETWKGDRERIKCYTMSRHIFFLKLIRWLKVGTTRERKRGRNALISTREVMIRYTGLWNINNIQWNELITTLIQRPSPLASLAENASLRTPVFYKEYLPLKCLLHEWLYQYEFRED